MSVFNATCPVEIGDKIVQVEKRSVLGRSEHFINMPPFHTITDIAAIHYVKTGKVEFRYELDNNGQYIPLNFPDR
jgi:hypothetical protein